jgi:predicted GNAT family acetyltransferase
MEEQGSGELHQVINNKSTCRFEISINENTSIIPYLISKNTIALFRTNVSAEDRGKGLAIKLVEYALNFAKENHLKILIFCPFIRKYVEEHQEWKSYTRKFQMGDLLLWFKYKTRIG